MSHVLSSSVRSALTLWVVTGAVFLPTTAAFAQDAREIASHATPAVVEIRALEDGDVTARGSGFLIRPDGVVVTNFHVIEDADALDVELATGEVFHDVYFLGADQGRDVALLKLPATQLPTLQVGDANPLAAGDHVFVVGNPLGMDRTFSDGLISARRVIDGVAYLQITAPVSEGSSGGPVLNQAGEVVGITTASITEGQNLNMAIPIGYAEGLLSVAGAPVPFADADFRAGTAARGRRGDDADADGEAPTRALADPRFEGMEPWERVVAEQLVELAQRLRAESYTVTDQRHFDVVAADSIDRTEFTLAPGLYRAIAVCDQDCSDIDLQVTDDDGEILDTDTLDDDIPIVDFTAVESGVFHFALQMVKCTTPTCFYGLQLYRKE